MIKWFDRTFRFDTQSELLPNVLERLWGTPYRLTERVAALPSGVLTFIPTGSWSIQEHVGHLLDLEPLWLNRLDDFQEGRSAMRPADLENIKTSAAGHNTRSLGWILGNLETRRNLLVATFEELAPAIQDRTIVHPRLNQPMRLVDFASFIAEHDDHHLAEITRRIRKTAA